MEPLELATFLRNSMLTVDVTVTGLDGTAADVSALTGDDIRWGLAARRGGPPLATVSLTPNSYGSIEIVDGAAGQIRIQFRAPVPPADPDPFRAKGAPYWQEGEVDLTEVFTSQFWGPVLIMPSMFTDA